MKRHLLSTFLCTSIAFLVGCSNEPDETLAVGTLERDRAELRAPVSESIAAVDVDDGDSVSMDARLLAMDARTADARLEQARAQAAASEARRDEIRRGARKEQVEQAQAALASARSEHHRASNELKRVRDLADRNLASNSQLDDAIRAEAVTAASIEKARAALAEMLNGATPEQLAQVEADLRAATARVTEMTLVREQLDVRAPFDGIVERVLVEPGDRVAAGTVLATVYRKGPPFASVFIPADVRTTLHVGDSLPVAVDGNGCVPARLRYIASEAAYTPYYALREDDRGRLVYAAEIDLPESASDLPTGIPVSVLAGQGCPQE